MIRLPGSPRGVVFLCSLAVPAHKKRFRISVMASHSQREVDRLLAVIEDVWAIPTQEQVLDLHAPATATAA